MIVYWVQCLNILVANLVYYDYLIAFWLKFLNSLVADVGFYFILSSEINENQKQIKVI